MLVEQLCHEALHSPASETRFGLASPAASPASSGTQMLRSGSVCSRTYVVCTVCTHCFISKLLVQLCQKLLFGHCTVLQAISQTSTTTTASIDQPPPSPSMACRTHTTALYHLQIVNPSLIDSRPHHVHLCSSYHHHSHYHDNANAPP